MRVALLHGGLLASGGLAHYIPAVQKPAGVQTPADVQKPAGIPVATPLLERRWPVATSAAPADSAPHFVLAGDSTTAPAGGWGAGFLSLLVAPAAGNNFGLKGTTTVSFKQKGGWTKVMDELKSERKKGRRVVVTVQFGHNDQKPDKGISVEQFKKNLEGMVKEIGQAGGSPILLTPLTRRVFSGDKVKDSLREQRVATMAVAKSSNTPVLDLNTASANYVNKIGQTAAHKFNLKEGDTTHLNPEGSKVFGKMVAELMVEREPGLGKWLKVPGGGGGGGGGKGLGE